MISVLLINPPQKYYFSSMGFNLSFPTGLLSIAARIKESCSVYVLDCLIEGFKISHKKDHILYGTTFEDIEEKIRRINPDIVAVAVPYSAQSENAVRISKICKKISKRIIVIFGGPDPTVRYKYFLEEKNCDFCIVGEGEDTFYDLIKSMPSIAKMKKCKGIAFRRRGKIVLNKREYISKLDTLPFPAYELINVKSYLKSRYLYRNRSFFPENSISVITSRGCTYSCIFCSINLHMGKKYRAQSPEYVYNHLKLLKEKYGINKFHFEDDNLTFERKRFQKILDLIIKNKMNILWDTPNGIRVDTLSYALLKKMKKSGCMHLTIAVESGDQKILDKVIKKRLNLKSVFLAAKWCHHLRIKLSAFYMLGLPGETIVDMEKTTGLALRLFREFEVIPQLNVATPLYGTELYKQSVKKGYLNKKMTNKSLSGGTQVYGSSMIRTKDFNPDDVKKIIHYYQKRLRLEVIIYGLKHPLFVLRRLIKNPDTLKSIV